VEVRRGVSGVGCGQHSTVAMSGRGVCKSDQIQETLSPVGKASASVPGVFR
jgi:hypothetical protein